MTVVYQAGGERETDELPPFLCHTRWQVLIFFVFKTLLSQYIQTIVKHVQSVFTLNFGSLPKMAAHIVAGDPWHNSEPKYHYLEFSILLSWPRFHSLHKIQHQSKYKSPRYSSLSYLHSLNPLTGLQLLNCLVQRNGGKNMTHQLPWMSLIRPRVFPVLLRTWQLPDNTIW